MNVVIWGAGREGRGFLGHLFAGRSELSFVDRDAGLVERLARDRRYRLLQRPPGQPAYEDAVSGFDAAVAGTAESAGMTARADVIALGIYPEDMPEAVPDIADGLRRRRKEDPDRPLDILIGVNAIHFAPRLRELFDRHLDAETREWFDHNVGLVETLVRRTCVSPPPEIAREDPLCVVTNVYPTLVVDAASTRRDYSGLDFIEPTRDMRMEERRKIYTYNLVHAAYAYLGQPLGHTFVHESRDNPRIQEVAERAYRQSGRALMAAYGIDRADMDRYEEVMWQYVVNPAMPDRIDRTGFDPIRKLARDERLVGPSLMCLRNGIPPEAIALVAAYAFKYDAKDDPFARRLLAEVARDGVRAAIVRHCGLDAEEPLAVMIAEAYEGIG